MRTASRRGSHTDAAADNGFTDDVFYLEYEAKLQPSHPEFRSVAGGIFQFWVDAPTAERADEEARAALASERYEVASREECREVIRAEFVGNPQRLELFDAAAVRGIAVSYFRWPA